MRVGTKEINLDDLKEWTLGDTRALKKKGVNIAKDGDDIDAQIAIITRALQSVDKDITEDDVERLSMGDVKGLVERIFRAVDADF